MTRVELDDGAWIELRDDLTMGDLEKISRMASTYSAEDGQWRDDPFRAALESVSLVVTEWTVADAAGNPLPPNSESLRGMPIKQGRPIIRAISEHIREQGLTPEDLADGSGT